LLSADFNTGIGSDFGIGIIFKWLMSQCVMITFELSFRC